VALLEVKVVGKRFGGLQAVNNLNLDVPKGGVVGLIGPNGAGKTTAFNLMTGLYTPDTGSILLDGYELAGRAPHEAVAHGICRTFQNVRLFKSLTALENVLIGAHLYRPESLSEALLSTPKLRRDEAELREHALGVMRTLGIERWATELAKNLPYGDQRRLEIARALASDPKLLLLDEPAAGMNSQETIELMHLVRSLRDDHGVTILLIEHDMRFVMGICEIIYVLDYGEVISVGNPEAIRSDPKVIEAYLGESPDEPHTVPGSALQEESPSL